MNNKELLDSWNNTLSNYSKLNFKEAKKIYLEIIKIENLDIKRKKINELIMNTLYVVYEFIKNNRLLYLNSYSYDMSDIISVCNEIWIEKINSGILLKVNSFKEIFDYDFYNKLSDKLNITKIIISENSIFNIKAFIDLLIEYIDLKQNTPKFSLNNFLNYIKSNSKYEFILSKSDNHIDLSRVCILFESIVKSFKLKDSDLKITKTNLKKLIYIIISNGYEYLRTDINNVVINNQIENWLDEYSRKQIIELILNDNTLEDRQKDILIKRFGLMNEARWSLEEISKNLKISRERIIQIENKTLRQLRHPMRSKKIKELI